MNSKEILNTYLDFYKDNGHKQIPNVSLVPENDPTLLFVNSGMFPLVPYLSGEIHPLGKRIVNVQRCLRFDDLEEIGDYNHTVAFHMIGNWSLGDYFKREQLPWVYEFFIEKLKLDPKRLFASVFEGDKDAPRDTESIQIIQDIFSKYGIEAKLGQRIFAYGKKDNWWKRGDAIGELGGPDSEVFYYLGEGSGEGKDPAIYDNEYLEIGNSVFMQYKKTHTGWEELPQKNVDFGGGLERIAMVVQGKRDIYETDNFWPIIEKLQTLTGQKYGMDNVTTQGMRIIADHMRTATFLAMDGVIPSNKDQGYMLKRVLRRLVRSGLKLNLQKNISENLVGVVVEMFDWLYPQLNDVQIDIEKLFSDEEEKFRKVLLKGSIEAKKQLENFKGNEELLAQIAYDLYQSLGYPGEMFFEDIKETPQLVNTDVNKVSDLFDEKISAHKEKSRTGAEHKFAGGLADQSEQTVKYHTATHLIHYALRKVLGTHITQQGSNITGERLRFDFSHEDKIATEDLAEIESTVNEIIDMKLNVNFSILPKEEAEKIGALHFFKDKYGDSVKVYYIGDSIHDAISKEFCGGPHVKNTNEIGHIEIYKIEKIGKGVTRLYARNK